MKRITPRVIVTMILPVLASLFVEKAQDSLDDWMAISGKWNLFKTSLQKFLQWSESSLFQVVGKLRNCWQRVKAAQQDDGSGQSLQCHRPAGRIDFRKFSISEGQKNRQNFRRRPKKNTSVESVSIKVLVKSVGLNRPFSSLFSDANHCQLHQKM